MALPPPATNLTDYLFPRNAFYISTIDLIKTVIEFDPLGRRKRHSAWIESEAIPKPLKKCEPLILGKIIDVKGWFCHTDIMSFAQLEGKSPYASSGINQAREKFESWVVFSP